MKNKTAAPAQPDASTQTADEQLIDFVKSNKNMLIAVVVGIAVIVAVSIIYVKYTEGKEDEAWATYTTAMTEGSSAAALREILSTVEGSTAEPWVLYHLSTIEFQEDELESSKATFDTLLEQYGDHYLFQNPKLAPSFRAKLEAEIDWRSKHPLAQAPPPPAPPEELEEPAEEEETSTEEPAESEETSGEEPEGGEGASEEEETSEEMGDS